MTAILEGYLERLDHSHGGDDSAKMTLRAEPFGSHEIQLFVSGTESFVFDFLREAVKTPTMNKRYRITVEQVDE